MKKLIPILLALLCLAWSAVPADAQSPGRSFEWTCSLDDIGATLTQCRWAPDPGMRLYLTDVTITSTTATAGLFLIRTGTGTNCGTGTVSLYPAAAAVPRLAYPANTAEPTNILMLTPIQAPSATAICIICSVTNTCTVQMSGFFAP